MDPSEWCYICERMKEEKWILQAQKRYCAQIERHRYKLALALCAGSGLHAFARRQTPLGHLVS